MISSEDPSFFGLSAGRVVPGVELNIHPESGEILVRGPNVGDRPKLKLKRDKNQFINTGDIGYLNEKGLLFLHGRKGEIFKYRDKWISSRKIEEKISAWPGSTRSCCLPRSCIDGKRPILFLQTDPSNLENLEKFLRTDLRDGEIPEDIYLMVALPHLENGKVDKVGLAKVGNFTDHVSLIAKKGKIRFWKIG
jgi:long-chain acyl-CoA synthetase